MSISEQIRNFCSINASNNKLIKLSNDGWHIVTRNALSDVTSVATIH